VLTAGTGGVNAGQIYVGTGTVTAGVPANVYGHVAVGDNQSLTGHFTVPAGYTGYLKRGSISSGTATNGYLTGKLKYRSPTDVISTAAIVTVYTGTAAFEFEYPIVLPAGSCVFANALTTKNDEVVSCYFQILLIKNYP
jgi:hypothetical protein